MSGDAGGNGRRHRGGARGGGRGDRDDGLEQLLAARHARLRRQPRRRRLRWLSLAAAVAALVLVGVAAAAVFTGRSVLLGACSLSDLRPISLGENSFVYARNGGLLGVVPSKTNRQPLELSRMSHWLPRATVSIEDHRFFEHGALDYRGIARAAYADLQAGRIVEGGSTITQELARNLYIGTSERTLSRKLKEACLAEKLAERMSKRQILAAYLNEVFYGHHAYGAQAGAQTYFSTTAHRLTLPQAALLAGLPQAPSTYDPFRHPDRALARRNEVLASMYADHELTRRVYAAARAAPLGLKPGKLYGIRNHPNFFGWATQQLIRRFGARRVEAGGLHVKTTLDPRMQAAALQAARDTLPTATDPATAVVAIDPHTGAVRAMAGYLPDGRRMQFNLATQAHRTTGSAFKPITLATAISQGVSVYSSFYGPSQLYITDPQCAGPDGAWDVHNYADESNGTMSLIDATAYSVNTIFAQLIAKVGVRNVVSMGHRLGIKSHLGYFCSDTLGSQAITPLDLTTVYATFASGGVYHPVQAIALARGPNGRVVGRLKTKGTRVLTPDQDALLTYVLQGVIEHGTGTAAAIARPAAGKTGTAENYQDAWFCGYVPQLATCVWVGYPKGEIPLLGIEGFGEVFGGSLPAEIWHRFMEAAVSPMPVEDFPQPTSFGDTYISGSGTYGWSPSYTSSSSSSPSG